MVPTIRPSPKTSILAPTRWGVEPRADTIVTSAAGSPRSSASATAAKTSWFTHRIIRAQQAGRARTGRKGREGRKGRKGRKGRRGRTGGTGWTGWTGGKGEANFYRP